MNKTINLNADLGESFGPWTMGEDEALLQVVRSANIACGFHAGDPRVLDRTVAECVARGVELGAHPGYPDLVGFGRRLIEASEDEIRTDVIYQLGALDAFARIHGGTISHVAPHGRMGSIAQTDRKHAVAITDAVKAYNDDYIVVCQRGVLAEESEKRGLKVAYVFLADRGYGDDGWPVNRHHPGGLIHDPELVGQRAIQVVRDGTVLSVDGNVVPLGHDCDVLLLHGDHPLALQNGQSVRRKLAEAGIDATGLRDVLAAKAEQQSAA